MLFFFLTKPCITIPMDIVVFPKFKIDLKNKQKTKQTSILIRLKITTLK